MKALYWLVRGYIILKQTNAIIPGVLQELNLRQMLT